MKKLFLSLLLSLPAACAVPGLTIVDCSLAREVLTNNRAGQYGNLRGYLRLRNDTDLELSHLKIRLHVLDGYGNQLFDLDPGQIALLKPHQQSDLALYTPYSGGVMQFQLSAEVLAQSAQGPQSYAVAAKDAGIQANSKPPGW